MKKRAPKTRHENGNILFIILITIVLLAALTYSVSRSGRTTSNMSIEESSIAANTIMQYADSLRTATQTVMALGTPVSNISFENNFVADYENNIGGSDKDKIFNSTGGGVTYKAPDAKWLDSAQSSQLNYGQWFFSRAMCVPYVGTGDDTCAASADSTDLVMVLPYIKKDICDAINNHLSLCRDGCTFVKALGILDSEKFTGSFGPMNRVDSTNNDFYSKTEGCAAGSNENGVESSDAYFYFKVLVER